MLGGTGGVLLLVVAVLAALGAGFVLGRRRTDSRVGKPARGPAADRPMPEQSPVESADVDAVPGWVAPRMPAQPNQPVPRALRVAPSYGATAEDLSTGSSGEWPGPPN
jgi:hypothetical protein